MVFDKYAYDNHGMPDVQAGPVTYSRIPSLETEDDLEGVFLAFFGKHGSEILQLQRSTSAQGQEWLTAHKLTGVPTLD